MNDGQMPLTHIKPATEADEERIWRLATLAEREACAKEADYYAANSPAARSIARAIRARGKA